MADTTFVAAGTFCREVPLMTKMVTIQGQQKWDYCLETRKTENSLLVTLNDLGQQGWELVDVLYYKDMKGAMSWRAFLKRPSVGQAPARSPQTAVVAAKPAPAVQAEETPTQPPGFDLSGDEFQLKPT
jgi:hypothetical protein